MRIDGSGNVCIPTTSPSYRLDVFAPAQASTQESLSRWRVSDDADAFVEVFNGTTTDGLFAPSIRARAPNNAARPGLIYHSEILTAYDSGTVPITLFDSRRSDGVAVTRPLFSFESFGTKYMTIAAGGNVGIGTTGPSYPLDVVGDLRASGYIRGSASGLYFPTSGQVQTAGGDLALNATSGSMLYKLNGVEKMRLDTTGYVGIGDPSPAALLTVGSGDKFQVDTNGNLIKVNNVTYSWPSAQGAASTVLQNNGSGTLSWAAASSGSVANTALSNLSGVAVNASLIPGTTNSIDLGSSGSNWRDLYLSDRIAIGTALPTDSRLKIYEPSTAFNLSKGLDVTMNGTQASASHTGIRLDISGAGNENLGIDARTTGGGTSRGALLYASSGTTGYGVYGEANSMTTSAWGGYLRASGNGTNAGVEGISNNGATGYGGRFYASYATTT